MVRLLPERSETKSNVMLNGFRASYMSSHTEEFWLNETVCLWMTIYIYIYIYIFGERENERIIYDSIQSISI